MLLKFNFARNLFWFNADGGSGSGGGAAGGATGAGQSSGNGNGSGSNADGGSDGGLADKRRTFTQDELNTLFAERARQASTKAVTDLLAGLGVKDPEELKTVLTKAREAEQAQLSELDKAKQAAAQAQAKIEVAERAKAEAEAKATESLLRGAVLAAASTFNDPDDAWVYVDKSKLKVNETTGKVEGIKEALEVVAKAKPYLLKAAQSTHGTPRNGQRQNNGRRNESDQPMKVSF